MRRDQVEEVKEEEDAGRIPTTDGDKRRTWSQSGTRFDLNAIARLRKNWFVAGDSSSRGNCRIEEGGNEKPFPFLGFFCTVCQLFLFASLMLPLSPLSHRVAFARREEDKRP